MDQLGGARAHEGGPQQDLPVEVDDHPGPAAVAVGVQPGTGDAAQVVVDGAHPVARLFGLGQGQAHRGGLRVGEDGLRKGAGVGGGRVGAPGGGVQRGARGAGDDGGARDAGLVLALMGEEGPVIDVPDGVQPVEAGHLAGLVDPDPAAGGQSDGVQADVLGPRRAAGRHQQFVTLDDLPALQHHADGPGGAVPFDRLDGHTRTDHRPRLAQGVGDELPREGLHPGQQAGAAYEDRHLRSEPLPGGGHLGRHHRTRPR